jgi:hypothetical protein
MKEKVQEQTLAGYNCLTVPIEAPNTCFHVSSGFIPQNGVTGIAVVWMLNVSQRPIH